MFAAPSADGYVESSADCYPLSSSDGYDEPTPIVPPSTLHPKFQPHKEARASVSTDANDSPGASPGVSNETGPSSAEASPLKDSSGTRTYIVIQGCLVSDHPDVPRVPSKADEHHIARVIYQYLASYGTIVDDFMTRTTSPTPTTTWKVAFDSVKSAVAAVADTDTTSGGNITVQGVNIWAVMLQPVHNLHIAVNKPDHANALYPPGTSTGDTRLGFYERAMVRRMKPGGTMMQFIVGSSRPGPADIPADHAFEYCLTFSQALSPNLNYSWIGGRDLTNMVISSRIRNGQDVRTTVMIRNIPNTIKQADLLRLLNDCVPGMFDFVYLRMDFNNGNNVGYGFVNFIRAEVILDFLDAIAYKRWANSNKVARLYYATWQGSEAMIAKFRNSNVMLQPHTLRPKLFRTVYDGARLCGLEVPFPPSDNPSKLQQSVANADNNGLFQNNNRGGHFGGSPPSRRRNGIFDRGTTFDMRQQMRVPLFHHNGLPPFNGPMRVVDPQGWVQF